MNVAVPSRCQMTRLPDITVRCIDFVKESLMYSRCEVWDSGTPGLIVCRIMDDPHKRWNVAHAATGAAVTNGLATRGHAAWVARRIGRILDWTQELNSVRAQMQQAGLAWNAVPSERFLCDEARAALRCGAKSERGCARRRLEFLRQLAKDHAMIRQARAYINAADRNAM